MKVPFFRPEIDDDAIQAVLEVLKSGWLTTGKLALAFEDAFCDYTNARYAVAVNSATAALHLGLEAFGVGPGDEVIVPSYTFTATAEVVRYLGADPVIVDVNQKNLSLSADLVENAITEKTKAVIPVHMAGCPAPLSEISEVTKPLNILILDDAAHCLPAKIDGHMIGSHPAAGATAFSFYANKTITTGEGGMLTTQDSEIADRCRKMRLHGIDRDVFARFEQNSPGWEYDVIAPGFKYNLTDIAAALGIAQLRLASDFQKRRQKLAQRYSNKLADLPLILPNTSISQGLLHSWHLYIIQLASSERDDRQALIDRLFENGVKTSVHYRPLHLMSYWKQTYGLQKENYPVSTKTFERCITLPLFPSMTLEEQDHVICIIKEFFEC